MSDDSRLTVVKLTKTAKMPENAIGSAGFDLFSDETVTIPANTNASVHTGLAIQPPSGRMIKLFDKSSVAVGLGVTVEAGVMDPNYWGEYIVVLRNHTDTDVTIEKGRKICQMIVIPFEIPQIVAALAVDEFRPSARGEAGFGSTGDGLE